MRFLNNVWNISVDIPKFNKAREATGTMETNLITYHHKSGDKQDPMNYRLVSVTSVIRILLGKIMRKQWVKLLEKHMISKTHSGIRLHDVNLYFHESFYNVAR